ncbi:hypothetical protein OEZ85_009288 [Tetradesmus obliquus]|uniref:Amino acid transporter transmembrane domain-containing protein n=1 Tax=Tetradesmus obliquus TaxID=3088 RepID=A0ABY8U8Y6_TETOB|nr:hypothetical protein OEZ85_009288 [Tetradesmus obliquus]
MVAIIRPLLCLSPAEKELEQLYREHVNKSYLKIDHALCLFKLSITVFCVAGLLAGAFPASKSGIAAWLAYLLTLALHAVLQQQPGFYAARRSWLVLLFKLLLTAVLMSLVVTCVLEPISSIGSYAKVLLMGSGIVMLNCTGICMPVIWRRHVQLSLLAVAAYNAALLPSVVDTLLCTPASRAYTRSLYRAIDATAFSVGGMLLPFQALALPEAAPRAQAYNVVLWLQLCLGLLVPLVCLYCQEVRSRSAFLQLLSTTTSTAPVPPCPAASAAPDAAPSADSAAAAAAALQRQSEDIACRAAALPKQPLLALLVVLLTVALWALMHAASGLIVEVGDGLQSARWFARITAQHGAGSCIGAGW